jgi:hypothetical protein
MSIITNAHPRVRMTSARETPGLPELEKFRTNLQKAMAAKNLNGSDVARAVWGTKIDKQGKQVARNRDRMTHYLSGKGYPRPETVTKLAEVLDLDPADLAREDNRTASLERPGVTSLPNYRAAREPGPQDAVSDEAPFTFTVLPDRAVQVDFRMKMDGPSAMRLFDLIRTLIPELRRGAPPLVDEPPEG